MVLRTAGMRVLIASAIAATACAIGCVDGKTPDCTSQDSGCYPTDSSIQPDVGGQSDAGDASLDTGSDVSAGDAGDAGDASDAAPD